MSPEQFGVLQRFLRDRSGLNLGDDKRYMLEARLGRLMLQHGVRSLGDLAGVVDSRRRPDLDAAVIDAMTTNETYFFRDRGPFEALRTKVLPDLIAARASQRRLSIWCAAAATGQEPYSIAMMLDELGDALAGWRLNLVATDICAPVLERAREGLYSQFEVQRGLPIRQLLAHFEKVGDTTWRISRRMRAMVEFRRQNLLDDFSGLGRFDLILCRNVLMYFDRPTRQAVLARMQRVLAGDGALVLGAAETLIGMDSDLATSRDTPGCYRWGPEGRLDSVA